MSEIIDQFYTPLLIEHGFIHDSDNQQYGALGDCWKLSPEVGEGTYWTYGQKDLYDIIIHNFSFHEDFMLECSLPECLSITRYDSISGEELSPYRRLSAGCIKTFIGGYAPYKALIHKNIPIRSVGIEIAPAYYEDYLKKLYPEAQINPVDAFRKIDQTSDFPEMSRLLTEIKDYRGEGIAAKLFYEGKISSEIYDCFRGGKVISGIYYKPTGKQKEIVEVQGSYLVEWKNFDKDKRYYIIETR